MSNCAICNKGGVACCGEHSKFVLYYYAIVKRTDKAILVKLCGAQKVNEQNVRRDTLLWIPFQQKTAEQNLKIFVKENFYRRIRFIQN